MGPSVSLAPLLVELGAVVPGRGFYFVSSHMDHVDEITEQAAAEYAANLNRIANIAASLSAPVA
jgi:FMN reductase